MQGGWEVYYKTLLVKLNWEKGLLVLIEKGRLNCCPQRFLNPVDAVYLSSSQYTFESELLCWSYTWQLLMGQWGGIVVMMRIYMGWSLVKGGQGGWILPFWRGFIFRRGLSHEKVFINLCTLWIVIRLPSIYFRFKFAQ